MHNFNSHKKGTAWISIFVMNSINLWRLTGNNASAAAAATTAASIKACQFGKKVSLFRLLKLHTGMSKSSSVKWSWSSLSRGGAYLGNVVTSSWTLWKQPSPSSEATELGREPGEPEATKPPASAMPMASQRLEPDLNEQSLLLSSPVFTSMGIVAQPAKAANDFFYPLLCGEESAIVFPSGEEEEVKAAKILSRHEFQGKLDV